MPPDRAGCPRRRARSGRGRGCGQACLLYTPAPEWPKLPAQRGRPREGTLTRRRATRHDGEVLPTPPSTIARCCGRQAGTMRAGRPLLVLLHGYGADEHDLFGLAPHLPPPSLSRRCARPRRRPGPRPATRGTPSRDSRAGMRRGRRMPASRLLEWLDASAAAPAGGAARILAGRRRRASRRCVSSPRGSPSSST